jgi:hypothetical protein
MKLRERLNLFFGEGGKLGRFGLLPVEYTLHGKYHHDFERSAGIYWTSRDGVKHAKVIYPPRMILKLITFVWQRQKSA